MADRKHSFKIDISAENRTQAAFNEIKRSMGEVQSASETMRGALAGIGAGLSIAGFAAFVKSGIDAADGLNKLSQKVGVTVESLSALQYAAQLSDISTEQLGTGLAKLAKTAAEAQAGSKEAAAGFDALGISVTEAGGGLKSTETLLLDVAEKFAGIEDGAGKTALAIKIFGRSGAELIPFLNQGRTGFEQLRVEAQRLGIVISGETARAAEEFNDNLTRMGKSLEALKISLAGGVLPELSRFIAANVEAIKIAGSAGEALRLFVFNLDAMTNEKPRETIERLTTALQKFQQAGAVGRFVQSPTGVIFGGREEDLKKQLEFVKYLEREAALARVAGQDNTDQNDRRLARTQTGRRAAPKLPESEKAARESDYEKGLRRLQDETIKTQELTRFQEVLQEIQLGRYGKLSEAQRANLLRLAAEATYNKQIAEEQKAVDSSREEIAKTTAARELENAERANTLARKYRDILDPLQKFRDQLTEIDTLELKGLLSKDEALELRFIVNVDMSEANEKLNGLKEDTKKADELARDLGLTFSSAFEDAIAGGKSLSEVLKALGQDIAKIITRKTITEPLGEGLTGLIKDSGAGKGIGGFFKSLFDGFRADGGPVSGGSAYIVGERGPELFMPATSGSIVPNHALGGGGPVFNVDMRGASVEAVARLERLVQQVNGSIESRALGAMRGARVRGMA